MRSVCVFFHFFLYPQHSILTLSFTAKSSSLSLRPFHSWKCHIEREKKQRTPQTHRCQSTMTFSLQKKNFLLRFFVYYLTHALERSTKRVEEKRTITNKVNSQRLHRNVAVINGENALHTLGIQFKLQKSLKVCVCAKRNKEMWLTEFVVIFKWQSFIERCFLFVSLFPMNWEFGGLCCCFWWQKKFHWFSAPI